MAVSLFENVIYITADREGVLLYFSYMLKKREHLCCSNEIQGFIEKQQEIILQKSHYLLNRLEILNFEGKVHLRQKLQGLQPTIKETSDLFASYIKVEEKIIFPFLETHIPRLASHIHLFRKENTEITKTLKEIKQLLKLVLSAQNTKERRKYMGILGEKITFLHYLMVSHFELEDNNLYKCIVQELHIDEQYLLLRKLIDCGNITSIIKDER